ncbi:MFS transporter [Bailinhaonella thermotolerans]|uniref:MFS transporter n=1 Tax=Bailinhaonella thermotolerans TaxID=1070861 RepID=A0A3A4A6Q4_9ACTN|nr:MFS transporter [Bailinhaonella thermotolerans]RJL23611.1 MFS transporter [Bailinhaonella thermotolerans]
MSATATPATTAPARGGGQARLLSLLLVANTAMFSVYMGVGGILLPAQVEALDPAAKVANLGMVSGISAIFATLFNPIGGMLSDRTHSRWGRRAPWLIGGSVAALATLALLGNAAGLLMILIGWSLAQAMMNLFQAALTAIIPDRVPRERRGTASAVFGIATSLGAIAGTQLAARFVGGSLGHVVLGSLVVAAAVLVVTLTRDPRPGEYEVVRREKTGLGGSLAGFVSALGHHDFRWLFISRALMVLSYFMLLGFMFFIVKDRIGVPSGMTAPEAVATATLVGTVCSIVFTLVGGPLSDRFDRRKTFVFLAAVLTGVSITLLLAAPSWPVFLLYSAIHSSAFGLFMAVDTALVTLVLPSEKDAARDMGILNIAAAGPQIASPFIAAAIISLGGYTALFVSGIVIALLGALAVLPVESVR